MKQARRVVGLTCIGLLLIAVGFGVRQRVLSMRRKPAIASADEAKLRALQQQVGPLLNQIHKDPKALEPRRALADFYQEQRLLEQALEQRIIVANLNPQNVDDRLHVATTLIALHSYPQAEGAYRYITQHWPKNIPAWQGLSTALFHQKRYKEAWNAGQQALKLDNNDGNSHLLVAISALDYVLQYPTAQAHADTLLMARKELESLTQVWPDNGDLFYQLGLACEAQHDQKARTLYLQRAVELLPKRGDAAAALARAYNSRGDRKTARKVLEDAVARKIDTAPLHDQLGQLIQASGEPDADNRALEEFRRATQLKADNATYLEHFAAACVRVNKLNEAKVVFERVTQLKPYRPYAYQQLAAIYTRLGDRTHATLAAKLSAEMYHNENQLKQVQQLSILHPDDVSLRLILADRYRELQQRGAARDEYLNILEIEPNNARAKDGLKTLKASETSSTTTSSNNSSADPPPAENAPLSH